jgi:hypothetical protein
MMEMNLFVVERVRKKREKTDVEKGELNGGVRQPL